MTEAIYPEVSEKTEAAKKTGRRVSVPGMLKFSGVSRSGYQAWLHHVPSDTEKRRKTVKAKIQDIYDDSKQNYGALSNRRFYRIILIPVKRCSIFAFLYF